MDRDESWTTHRSSAIMRASDKQGYSTKSSKGRKNKPYKTRSSRKKWILRIVIVVIIWLLAVLIYQMNKPLPEGVSYESPVYRTDNVDFLYDLTSPTTGEKFTQERQIFDRTIEMINEAEQFIVIDVFLFNDYTHEGQEYPKVSGKLAKTLIDRKQAVPDLDVTFITDEVNTNYGSSSNALLESLKKAGIKVVITDTDPLRDSTPIYSAFWRTFIQWFGQSGNGKIPNLMASDGPDITLRSYLKLLNVKANHRKAFITEKSAIVSSGNIHDASAYHSNIALEVNGPIIGDLLKAEQAILDFSGGGTLPVYTGNTEQDDNAQYAIQYLTEGKVHTHVIAELDQATSGDTVWMGMFYLADYDVLQSLMDASDRGAEIRLVLDPNENAFGRDKIGIPNRPVAAQLHNDSPDGIQIRWYNTTKEQYHTKMLFIDRAQGESSVLAGSTNFTPRNMKDYNLENELFVSAPKDSELSNNVRAYFEKIWNNDGAEYTLDLDEHLEASTWLKDIVYRIQMRLGFTTF